jgi:UTP-glucose-1-phosphate uridylyltransferase
MVELYKKYHCSIVAIEEVPKEVEETPEPESNANEES